MCVAKLEEEVLEAKMQAKCEVETKPHKRPNFLASQGGDLRSTLNFLPNAFKF